MEQEKIIERLLEVTRNLSTMVDLETCLQSILSAAAELTDSETASLMEYDEPAGELRFRYVPWFHREAIGSVKIPLDKSVAGWVFLHVEPLIIDDVKNDPRHYEKVDSLSDFDARSLLAVPLIFHGRPMGVLEVFNKTEKYGAEDIHTLESLASLAITALQNDNLEKDLLASQKEVRDLDRMKNEFIAITSHELRTPLGLVLGHATFLRELVGDRYQDQVDAIIRSASKLKEILENLSTVDNYQTGGASLRSRKVSIRRLIEDVTTAFREMAAQKSVTLKAEIQPNEELFLNADGNKLSVALSNLVKNALTFTRDGGHIIIRGSREGNSIKVSVEDDGIGIPAQDLERIFERFYQVESHLTRKHGGMGLGLSVARSMVEHHGGRIWAESKEGVGSRFTFLLPLDAKPEEPVSAKPFAQ